MVKNFIGAGYGLSVGSSVIGKLPASAAQTNVQAGLQSGSSFFPVIGNIKGAGLALKGIKKLK